MSLLFAALLLQTGQPDWKTALENARQAYGKHDVNGAVGQIAQAVQLATKPDDGSPVEALRQIASVCRESGDYVLAQGVLGRATQVAPAESLTLASVLEELAVAQRAGGRSPEALATIEKAIDLRQRVAPDGHADLARDLTFAGLLWSAGGDADKVIEVFRRALNEWEAAPPGDPQALVAMEALGAAYRDRAQYEEAEPLFARALRLREASNGPDSSEVITAIDSLAYTEFGLKKFTEAEPLYQRLLALWQKHGGPDHPMIALTLDKMAEFYAFQQRYVEAEQCARDGLAIRARMHLASLHQTGRVLLMEEKMPEADKLYHEAVQIGDLSHAADADMDPLLRVYATILREQKRNTEAAAVEKRVKDAVLRKADREGRRPSPVQARPR